MSPGFLLLLSLDARYLAPSSDVCTLVSLNLTLELKSSVQGGALALSMACVCEVGCS